MIETRKLDNGLTVIVEPIGGVASCAMSWLIPGGAVHEPDNRVGLGQVLTDMMLRGAGDRDARQHCDALDALGVRRSMDTSTWHTTCRATFLAEHLEPTLSLLTDAVRRPRLEDAGFEPARQLAVQALEALDDEPQDKAMVLLKERHLGDPLGRPTVGRADDLAALDADAARAFHANLGADGAILALAGAINADDAFGLAERLLGDWGTGAMRADATRAANAGTHHVHADSTQQHIGLAFDTVGETDPDIMAQRLGVAVLSGGMSGRLFTEVREKRGLCYSVYATLSAQRDFGTIYAYAGTTVERAGETLAVLTDQLKQIAGGVSDSEFERAVVGLKSRLVMQGESTGARAGALAASQFFRGRAMSLGDVNEQIDAVDREGLNRFLAGHAPGAMTVMNVGPEPLSAGV